MKNAKVIDAKVFVKWGQRKWEVYHVLDYSRKIIIKSRNFKQQFQSIQFRFYPIKINENIDIEQRKTFVIAPCIPTYKESSSTSHSDGDFPETHSQVFGKCYLYWNSVYRNIFFHGIHVIQGTVYIGTYFSVESMLFREFRSWEILVPS